MHFHGDRRASMRRTSLQRGGIKFTEFILSSILVACAKLGAVEEGRRAHCAILKQGFTNDVVLMTSLVDMYAKCSRITDAHNVFAGMRKRDTVATNAMISGLFRNRLTSMAVQLFETAPERDEAAWNSVISGLAQNSAAGTALVFFRRMRTETAKIDTITMVSVLSACAYLASLVHGYQIHATITKHGFGSHLPVGNAAVNMYARCGCMASACLYFNNMPCKNVISWTCLIQGYGKHGMGLEALRAFKTMEAEGIVPNKISFLTAMYACSHAGLVHQGCAIFNMMISRYSLTPIMEHYTSMVDLLARAGRLIEAYNFIKKMPLEPDEKLLMAFLSSCCSHKNLQLGMVASDKLLQLEPRDAGAYMLLSKFYGFAGDTERVSQIRRLMIRRDIRKEKALTWIEINKKVHCFESGDRSHPFSERIYSYLQSIVEKMKQLGYVPNTSMTTQDVADTMKEEIVLSHSEKLAIGLGMISTPAGTKIMIIKNLRMCLDCHVATALISKIEGREIVARDLTRFHYFRDGHCSCGNHW